MIKYKFSLILCTLGRTDFVESFLKCLSKQNYDEFEVILVDQNKDNRLDNIVKEYSRDYSINHVKAPVGLSKSRNIGLKHVNGDIVAFPDDDCLYSKSFLNDVNKLFNKYKKYDIISIKMTNSVKNGRKVQENYMTQEVKKEKIMKLVASISIFLKIEVIKEVGEFDENLGLGSGTIFTGGEDYDYPIRALDSGYKILYSREVEVFHPWDDDEIDRRKNLDYRMYGGGASEMYIMNKHNYSFLFKIKRICRRFLLIIYFIIKIDFYKARLSFKVLQGMIDYFNYKVVI